MIASMKSEVFGKDFHISDCTENVKLITGNRLKAVSLRFDHSGANPQWPLSVIWQMHLLQLCNAFFRHRMRAEVSFQSFDSNLRHVLPRCTCVAPIFPLELFKGFEHVNRATAGISGCNRQLRTLAVAL